MLSAATGSFQLRRAGDACLVTAPPLAPPRTELDPRVRLLAELLGVVEAEYGRGSLHARVFRQMLQSAVALRDEVLARDGPVRGPTL